MNKAEGLQILSPHLLLKFSPLTCTTWRRAHVLTLSSAFKGCFSFKQGQVVGRSRALCVLQLHVAQILLHIGSLVRVGTVSPVLLLLPFSHVLLGGVQCHLVKDG